MNREQFIAEYNAKTNAPSGHDAFSDGRLIALPCDCQEKLCSGWAAIRTDPDNIRHQLDLCTSKERIAEVLIILRDAGISDPRDATKGTP